MGVAVDSAHIAAKLAVGIVVINSNVQATHIEISLRIAVMLFKLDIKCKFSRFATTNANLMIDYGVFMMQRMLLGLLSSMFLIISAQAADFKWMDDKGEIYTLSETYKGQPVIVHFWASWCPPCVAEMPEMATWLNKHPNVNVLPVSLDNNLETAQLFLQQNQIAMPALLTDNSQSGRMGVRGLPTTIPFPYTHLTLPTTSSV